MGANPAKPTGSGAISAQIRQNGPQSSRNSVLGSVINARASMPIRIIWAGYFAFDLAYYAGF